MAAVAITAIIAAPRAIITAVIAAAKSDVYGSS